MRKQLLWVLGVVVMGFVISCQNPSTSTNYINVQAVNYTTGTCPVFASLDSSGPASLSYGYPYAFSSVSAGAHVFKFTTSSSCSGSGCVYTNNGLTSYSVTFTAVSGVTYTAAVTQGLTCAGLIEQGP